MHSFTFALEMVAKTRIKKHFRRKIDLKGGGGSIGKLISRLRGRGDLR